MNKVTLFRFATSMPIRKTMCKCCIIFGDIFIMSNIFIELVKIKQMFTLYMLVIGNIVMEILTGENKSVECNCDDFLYGSKSYKWSKIEQ